MPCMHRMQEARSLYEQQFSDTTDFWSDELMASITDRDLLCVHCSRTNPGLVTQLQIQRRKKYDKLFIKKSTSHINKEEEDDDSFSLITKLKTEDG